MTKRIPETKKVTLDHNGPPVPSITLGSDGGPKQTLVRLRPVMLYPSDRRLLLLCPAHVCGVAWPRGARACGVVNGAVWCGVVVCAVVHLLTGFHPALCLSHGGSRQARFHYSPQGPLPTSIPSATTS
jgi:hypothetical protein